MLNLRRTALALGAVSLAAGSLAACGEESIPGNAVVRVGDTAIKKDAFNHWLEVAALSTAAQSDPTAATSGKRPAVSIPDPPDFKDCVAGKKKTAPKPAKGQPTPTDASLTQQCKTDYEALRNQVLEFLISSQWIQGEADSRNVSVSDAEVKKQFDTTKKQSFPKDEDYRKFLVSSGMTEADLLFRVRLDSLSNKLRDSVIKGKDKVTDAQIAEYYNKNKTRFAQPERRDLRIVLTKTEARASEAKGKLQGGASFSTIAKQYSTDPSSKAQGGVLLQVAKGQQEKALDDAVFAAKKGTLSGPIKTQFGYYVFQVQKITKASQQTQAQAKETIKQLLASQNQQKALETFVKDFQSKWKDQTECRKDFTVDDCDNAPKAKTTTATTPSPTPTPTPGTGVTGQ